MSKEYSPRQVSLEVSYKGGKQDEDIQKHTTGFSYTDVASGASDSISISLENIDKKWLNEWYPEKGSSITAKLELRNWEKSGKNQKFTCGKFIIDDMSFSGRPLTATLGAVSVPANTGFKLTKKSKTWEDVTIEQIAAKIAAAAGISLYYSAPTIKISEVEQSKETDSAFLYSLCVKYGLAMKVYNQKLIIFDEETYEQQGKIFTIDEKDIIPPWNFNSTMDGTYTGVRLTYTKPDTDKTISVLVGTEERLYEYDAQADSQYDAELQAKAKLRSENKKAKTLEIKIMANPDIIATSIVQITGLGKLNGLYYVDQVKHNIGTGYIMSLSMHWFADSREEKKAKASGNYVVQRGDTLTGISVRFYKTGVYWRKIYEANKEVIESTAKQRGYKSSDNGHWIFPGTVLVIPDKEVVESAAKKRIHKSSTGEIVTVKIKE